MLNKIKNNIKYYLNYSNNIKEINKIDKSEKKIVLLGSPEYNNLGDHLIAYATKIFIEDNFKEYRYYEISEKNILHCINKVKKYINDDDVILLQGGGNMGDLYLDQVNIRKKVLTNFINNKIIIMPQTIYFSSPKNYLPYYYNNLNLHIFAREQISYDILKNMRVNNLYLVPDIAIYLINNLSFKKNNRKGILMCLRDDKEKSDIKFSQLDSDIFNSHSIINVSTVLNVSVSINDREQILFDLFNKFTSSSLVVTDRLHGMIIAAITHTPCIVLPTFNHKVIESYKWLKRLGYVYLLNQEDDIARVIKQVSNIKIDKNINYSKDFSELKKCIGTEYKEDL